MSRYYVTLGMGDCEPKTYKTDDLELALNYQRHVDEYAEILDCETGTMNCGGRVPPVVVVKELPKLYWDNAIEEWAVDTR